MQNKTILLVDDEASILQSLAKDLKQMNFSVTKAESGEEAISLLKEYPFNLVVTDLVMSGLGGIQVLKEAKKKDPLISVMILTGYGDITTAIDALRLGADDYLLKPCEPDEFILRIEKCLEKQEAFQKVKLYEKLLPMCSFCKKIRSDDGNWEQVDIYLHRHSDADISHSICQECMEKHYPEQYKAIHSKTE